MKASRYVNRTGLTVFVGLSLATAVLNSSESEPVTFSDAVEQVAVHGGSVALTGTDCSFDQLDSDTVEVQKINADEADFAGAIIASVGGAVTEFGNVQCIILDHDQIELRGGNGL